MQYYLLTVSHANHIVNITTILTSKSVRQTEMKSQYFW